MFSSGCGSVGISPQAMERSQDSQATTISSAEAAAAKWDISAMPVTASGPAWTGRSSMHPTRRRPTKEYPLLRHQPGVQLPESADQVVPDHTVHRWPPQLRSRSARAMRWRVRASISGWTLRARRYAVAAIPLS
jgi:hypothetical protein